jgi:hypothetical protein
MWTKDGVLNYCKIGESGKKVGKIYTMDADLSDCVPIVTDQKLVWYTWDYSFVDFYEIDLTNLSKTNVYQRLNGEIQTERNIWNTSVTLSTTSHVNVTVKSGKLTTTISKLSAKKTYYIRIRTYSKVSGKYYFSAWSKATSVKTK